MFLRRYAVSLGQKMKTFVREFLRICYCLMVMSGWQIRLPRVDVRSSFVGVGMYEFADELI